MYKTLLSLIIIAAISTGVYLNSLRNSFVYDDSLTIVENHFIKDFGNLPYLLSQDYFKWSGEISYRPLVTFTYFLDYSLWGLTPIGYHLNNISIHTINCLLLYLFILLISKDQTAAFLGSVLFATHPVLTEAVNGISYREDLLAAMFLLISLLLYFKSRPQKNLLYLGSLASYLAGLLAKEMAITLPLLIIIADYTIYNPEPGIRLKSLLKRFKKNYLWFFIVSCIYLLIRFVILRNQKEDVSYPGIGLIPNFIIMTKVIAYYIKLLVLPVGLRADYSLPASAADLNPSSVIAIIMPSMALLLIIKTFRYSGLIAFSIIWFFISLIPVYDIVPIANIMAERYLYIPSMGFCMAISLVSSGILRRPWFEPKPWPLLGVKPKMGRINHIKPDIAKTLALICVTPLIITYSILTINRNRDWRDDLTLWSKASIFSPDSPMVHNNLGKAYWKKGMIKEAGMEFERAIELNPQFLPPYVNYSSLCKETGELEEAYRIIKLALKVDPDSGEAYNNLGNICEKMDSLDEATKAYTMAVELMPDNPVALNNLATVYIKKGLFDESDKILARIIQINPEFSEAHYNLGILYKKKGLLNEAVREFKKAIQIKPNLIEARHSLADSYLEDKLVEKAVKEYEASLDIDPNNVRSYYNLANIYLKIGEFDKAITEYKKGLELNPNDPELHNNLGIVYVKKGLLDQAISSFKEAIRLQDTRSNPHNNLGNVYYMKGLFNEAEKELKLAIKYDNRNAKAHKSLGLLYLHAKNDPENALLHLKEAIRLEPEQNGSETILRLINNIETHLSK